jgi:hypothetical protein
MGKVDYGYIVKPIAVINAGSCRRSVLGYVPAFNDSTTKPQGRQSLGVFFMDCPDFRVNENENVPLRPFF